jgi:hypothetical protein
MSLNAKSCDLMSLKVEPVSTGHAAAKGGLFFSIEFVGEIRSFSMLEAKISFIIYWH